MKPKRGAGRSHLLLQLENQNQTTQHPAKLYGRVQLLWPDKLMGTEPQLKKHYVFGFCYLKKKKKERERELKEMEIPHNMVKDLICKGTNGGREREREREGENESNQTLFFFYFGLSFYED